MATLRELEMALVNADKAGDLDAARKLAAAIQDARAQAAPEKEKRGAVQEVGRQVGLTARHGIEGIAAGAGSITDPILEAIGGAVRAATGTDYDAATLASIGRKISDALGLPQPETSSERLVGALSRGVVGGAGGARTAATVAAKTTGTTQQAARALAAQPTMQAVSGGAAGAAGQAVAEGGGGAGEQLAAALAAGVAAPVAAGAVARGVSAVRGGAITPEQQAIIEAGQKAAVPVMTSDVLPPKTFMGRQAQAVGERVPVVGTGAVREGQQAARQAAVTDLAQQYGTPSYEAIVSSIKGKVGSIKKAAGRVIDKTGQQLDNIGPITPTRSVAAIDSALGKLSAPNVYNPGNNAQIQQLTDLKNVLIGDGQTFSTLRQSRTAVRELMESVDAQGRSQLPSYAKKLVGDVYSAMKGDLDNFASLNLSPQQVVKLERANKVYGDEAQLLKASRLKNVLDKGDVTPEVVRNMIYSNKPSENKILYDSLGTVGRQQVKAALIDDAATKALRNGEINPNAFGSELAKHDKKLDVFFKGDERKALQGFTRLLQVTRRAQTAADAPTTTGASLLPYGLGAAAFADLGATLAGAVTAGGFARLYESPAMRNLLLKLQGTPPNSANEGGIMRSVVSVVREESDRQNRAKKEAVQEQ